MRNAGQISTPVTIPAGDERLAVDVGPGRDGRPTLAFVSCSDRCRVVIAGVDGSGAQTVPGSEDASAPTIWGSRVAWVRGRATVLMRDIASGTVTRLPGVPLRKCYVPLERRRCERPSSRSVQALELYHSRLALIVSYGLSQGGGNGQTEVRTEFVKRRPRQHLVALMNVGEGGQAFVGPSWARGHLFFLSRARVDARRACIASTPLAAVTRWPWEPDRSPGSRSTSTDAAHSRSSTRRPPPEAASTQPTFQPRLNSPAH